MMIDDEELRMTFQFASEDHLQKLDEGLLYLEKHPKDPEKLAAMLREAHSLKGDSAMLGVKDVSTLAPSMGTVIRHFEARNHGAYRRIVRSPLFRVRCHSETGE
jgi:two-component system chemotaxis sensor kinase CheA